MKLFKRIYYPVMAALMVLMLILGFVDATYGGNPKNLSEGFMNKVGTHIAKLSEISRDEYNPAEKDKASNYIVNELEKSGLVYKDSTIDDDGDNIVTYATDASGKLPTITVQEAVISGETAAQINKNDGIIPVAKTVKNIVVAIPGKNSAGNGNGMAAMSITHYNSRPDTKDALGSASLSASMLENIKYILESDESYDNDLLFVFADANESKAYGEYAFKYQFKGFDDIFSRTKIVSSFTSDGTDGSLMMYKTSGYNLSLLGEYSKINKTAYASSLLDYMSSAVSDNGAAFDIPSLGFTNIGGGEFKDTYRNNYDNINKPLVRQQANMMNRYVNCFGNTDLGNITSGQNAVFFSYLDMFIVFYPVFVAFIIAGIIIGLFAAIFALNAKFKAFNVGKMFMGALTQLLTVAATALCLFAGYYIIALLLVGFGVLPINSISGIMYSSVGLNISVMILALALATIFYIVLKKAFNVKAADVVRGNVILWAAISIILSFAVPSISFIAAIPALLLSVTMLLSTIFKNKFKNKYGMDIERLFLYCIPMILCLPILLPTLQILTMTSAATMLPLIMVIVLMIAGVISPYFSYFKPMLDKLMKKLPERTILVQRVVTERIEDPVKKGRFTEQTVKKVTKEKTPWKYYNRMGVSVVGVVAVIMIIFFSAFGANYGSAIAGSFSYEDAIYNDSLVYVWEKNGDSVVSANLEIHDHMAYKKFSYALRDYKWDNERKAYIKSESSSLVVTSGREPTIDKTNDVYSFKPFDIRSTVTLKFSGIKSATKFTFTSDSGSEFIYENIDNAENLTFDMPYAFGGFKLAVSGVTNMGIEYDEKLLGSNNNLQNLEDWKYLTAYFADNTEIAANIKGGIHLKYSLTK